MSTLQHLVALNLEGTCITDARFGDLCESLPGIRRLGLRGVKVTEEGLSKLHILPRLDAVDLALDSVSLRTIRKAVLGTRVTRVVLTDRHLACLLDSVRPEGTGAVPSVDGIAAMSKKELQALLSLHGQPAALSQPKAMLAPQAEALTQELELNLRFVAVVDLASVPWPFPDHKPVQRFVRTGKAPPASPARSGSQLMPLSTVPFDSLPFDETFSAFCTEFAQASARRVVTPVCQRTSSSTVPVDPTPPHGVVEGTGSIAVVSHHQPVVGPELGSSASRKRKTPVPSPPAIVRKSPGAIATGPKPTDCSQLLVPDSADPAGCLPVEPDNSTAIVAVPDTVLTTGVNASSTVSLATPVLPAVNPPPLTAPSSVMSASRNTGSLSKRLEFNGQPCRQAGAALEAIRAATPSPQAGAPSSPSLSMGMARSPSLLADPR
jgi:hypothetical protein